LLPPFSATLATLIPGGPQEGTSCCEMIEMIEMLGGAAKLVARIGTPKPKP